MSTAHAAMPVDGEARAPQALDRPTVLVVDDEKVVRKAMGRLLRAAGFGVETAEDGAQAQVRLAEAPERFHTVVLDWHMPRMDGLALLDWIKSQPGLRAIPVVMQTADVNPEKIREGIDKGAFYFLTKPYDQALLTTVVHAAVSDYAAHRSLIDKMRAREGVFGLLAEGTFNFRTIDEAEQVAVTIASMRATGEELVGISELLFNAVEHGNLGISYDDKTDLINDGRWLDEVNRRLGLPEYADKFVEVRVRRDADGIHVSIRDQGPGFEYGKYLELDESRVFDNHGRGIAMAGMQLDIRYVDPGNEVHVRVPFD